MLRKTQIVAVLCGILSLVSFGYGDIIKNFENYLTITFFIEL